VDVPADVEIGGSALPALSQTTRGVDSTKKVSTMKKNSTSEPVDATALVTDA
jgi:hypothetical protein